jgi:hypothetical protein
MSYTPGFTAHYSLQGSGNVIPCGPLMDWWKRCGERRAFCMENCSRYIENWAVGACICNCKNAYCACTQSCKPELCALP